MFFKLKPFFSLMFVFFPFLHLAQQMEETLIVETEENTEIINELMLESEARREFQYDLNRMNYEDWVQLGVLTDQEIQAILTHKRKYGDFIQIYELQAVDELDSAAIQRILPFIQQNVRLSFRANYQLEKAAAKSNFTLRFKRPFLSLTTEELSTLPISSYLRFSHKVPEVMSFQLHSETDAFEGYKKGMDFYGGFLHLKLKKGIKDVIIGDYEFQFGRGASSWSSLALRQSLDFFQNKTEARGLFPKNSAQETQGKRGIALRLNYSNLELNIGMSLKKTDGYLSTQTEQLILQQTGLHRTELELKGRKNLLEKTFFTSVNLTKSRLKHGFLFLYKTLSEQTTSAKHTVLNTSYFFSLALNNSQFTSESSMDLTQLKFNQINEVIRFYGKKLNVSLKNNLSGQCVKYQYFINYLEQQTHLQIYYSPVKKITISYLKTLESILKGDYIVLHQRIKSDALRVKYDISRHEYVLFTGRFKNNLNLKKDKILLENQDLNMNYRVETCFIPLENFTLKLNYYQNYILTEHKWKQSNSAFDVRIKLKRKKITAQFSIASINFADHETAVYISSFGVSNRYLSLPIRSSGILVNQAYSIKLGKIKTGLNFNYFHSTNQLKPSNYAMEIEFNYVL